MSQSVNMPLTVSNSPVISGEQVMAPADQDSAGSDFDQLLTSTISADAQTTAQSGSDGKVLPALAPEQGNGLPVQVINAEMEVMQLLPAVAVESEVIPQVKGLPESVQQLINNIQTSVDIKIQPMTPGATQHKANESVEPDLTVLSAGVAPVATDVQGAVSVVMQESAEKNPDAGHAVPVPVSIAAASLQLPAKEHILVGSEDAPVTTAPLDEDVADTGRRQIQSSATTDQNKQQTGAEFKGQQVYPPVNPAGPVDANVLFQGPLKDDTGKAVVVDDRKAPEDVSMKTVLETQARVEGKEGHKLINDPVKQFAALVDSVTVNTAKAVEIPQPSAFNTVISGQGTGGSASNVANTGITVPVTVPLHHPKWGDAVGERLVWMVNQGVHVAELKLNPANLGQLEVRITMIDNQANVAFSSPHMQVRDAIEASLPKLRELMQEGGMTLNNTSVSDQSPREQRHANHAHTMPQSQFGAWDELEEGESNRPVVAQSLMSGMVDTYV